MRTPLLVATAFSLLLVASGPHLEETVAAPISATELADRMKAGSAPFVLDVRTPGEHANGHIPGAANIPHDELAARIGELTVTKSEEIVVHCHSGGRARVAEAALRAEGYSNVRDLTGHWQAWHASGLPTESGGDR